MLHTWSKKYQGRSQSETGLHWCAYGRGVVGQGSGAVQSVGVPGRGVGDRPGNRADLQSVGVPGRGVGGRLEKYMGEGGWV